MVISADAPQASRASRARVVPRLARHVALPALAPAAIVGLYLMPVTVIGCANRGLVALGVVALSTIGALICAVTAVRASSDSREAASWWVLSAAILVVPAALAFGPLA